MIYCIQNRYQDSGWSPNDETFDHPEAAFRRAWEMAGEPVIYGMVRVLDNEGNVLVTLGAGENRERTALPITDELIRAVRDYNDRAKQSLQVAVPAICIPSPNGAEPGSLVHAAEQWMLKNGMTIPAGDKFPHLYQAMCDEFCDSDDYDIWERS